MDGKKVSDSAKLLVLLGSPHKNGTTKALAGELVRGAQEALVPVQTKELYVPGLRISPCLGCGTCQKNGGQCVFKDDMEEVKQLIREADIIAFVSPLYYFGFTAQLKAVLDRFFSFNKEMRAAGKKAVLLAAGADSDDWAMDGVRAHYETLLRYLNWESAGEVLALGCAAPGALAETGCLQAAYELGTQLAKSENHQNKRQKTTGMI